MSENTKILVIEDDDLMQVMLKDALAEEKYRTVIASDGREGWQKFLQEDYAVILLDLKLPKMDGLTVLKKIKTQTPEAVVIIMTAFGSIETAIEAMKAGAYDYVTKPFLKEDIVYKIKRALETEELKTENYLLRRELDEKYSLENIIGKCDSMQKVFHIIRTVANNSSTVLISGESGTGKELAAEAIHHLGPRKKHPLIKVSCAVLTETLLESELFGHEKGAFTDAVSRKIGRFELADKGTIFLDDIDDLNPQVQVKLLRVLQEREFERVGGSETIHVDVRIIAATKIDLLEKVKGKSFREDLYYRLNVIPLLLPPLRDRQADIPLLAEYFLKRTSEKTGKTMRISPDALQVFIRYTWPGNIREIQNLIERLCALAQKEEILSGDLPRDLFDKENLKITTLDKAVRERETELIREVLRITGGKKKEAAEILGITAKTLWQKSRDYHIT